MHKVSIIIPCYNSSKFIERTIKSVFSQTFSDWELILIDDCSTDNTIEIIKKYKEQDPKIKLFKTEKNSGGPATPKNIGVASATGSYIAFLDHDDEWLPKKLEKQVRIFEESNDEKLGIVFCGAFLVNKDNKIFSTIIPKNFKNILPEILIRNPIQSNSSVVVKKSVIDKVGNRDQNLKYSEDYEMWLKIAKNSYKFFSIEEPLFKYHIHGENVTNNILLNKKVKDMEYTFNKHIDLYNKYDYVHIGYFRLAVMCLLAEDIKNSRLYFLKSLKYKGSFIPSYFGYIFSFLGIFGIYIVNFIIFLYRITKGKKYLILFKS